MTCIMLEDFVIKTSKATSGASAGISGIYLKRKRKKLLYINLFVYYATLL